MFKNLFYKFICKKIKTKKCSFCACSENAKNPFIAGDNNYICCNCVCSAHKILFGDLEYEEDCQSGDIIDEYDEIDFLYAVRK